MLVSDYVAKLISENLSILIIMSGGCSIAEHFIQCFKQTKFRLYPQVIFFF